MPCKTLKFALMLMTESEKRDWACAPDPYFCYYGQENRSTSLSTSFPDNWSYILEYKRKEESRTQEKYTYIHTKIYVLFNNFYLFFEIFIHAAFGFLLLLRENLTLGTATLIKEKHLIEMTYFFRGLVHCLPGMTW